MPSHWSWIALGLLLLGAEIFTGGFGLFWFGIAAFGAALLAWSGFGLTTQIAALATGGVLLAMLTRPLTRRWFSRQTLRTGSQALVGRTGVVTRRLGAPDQPYGYIRLQNEEWRATALIPLEPGAPVRVSRIEGATLIVEPVTEHGEDA